jgi:hypothetical protein
LSIEIPAGGWWRQVFQTTRAEGGRLTARLDRPDCYLADNRATVLVPPCRRYQVYLEGDKNLYLEKALAANPRVSSAAEGVRAEGERAERERGQSPLAGTAPPPSAVPRPPCPVRVIYGPVPKTLPAGPLVVLCPEGPCDLWQPGDAIAEPVVARQAEGKRGQSPFVRSTLWAGTDRRLVPANGDCPLFPPLIGIRLAKARKLSLRPQAEPLAQPLAWAADGSPLAYAIARAEGRVLVLAGSLEEGDWPQRTAFPIFLANALDWVAARPVGNALRGVPQPAEEGYSQFVERHGGRSLQADMELSTSSPDIRVPQQLAGKTVASEDREFPLWICFAGLAGLLLTAEWCLYHRRWTC